MGKMKLNIYLPNVVVRNQILKKMISIIHPTYSSIYLLKNKSTECQLCDEYVE